MSDWTPADETQLKALQAKKEAQTDATVQQVRDLFKSLPTENQAALLLELIPVGSSLVTDRHPYTTSSWGKYPW